MSTEVEQQKQMPTTENSETNGNVVSEELKTKIVKQVEYYFGNYNLPRDKFLSEQVKVDEGWIPMDTMVKFKRLADLSTNFQAIMDALKNSELMEVDEEKKKIRRSPDNPLPYFGEDLKAETLKRTIYCKGLPKDGSVNLDKLLEHFKPYGPFETIHMRQYFDKAVKKHGFKGSILIVFPAVEKAQEFMKIDDVQYEKKPLLRKWHQDYLEEKTEEIKERKARKQARLEQLEKEKEGNDGASSNFNEIEPIPRGSFLFASGFSNTTTREDIKSSLMEFTNDVAFLDFSKGHTEGYIRLSTPFSNKELFEKIDGKLKVNGEDITVRLVEGEEEDTQIKKAEEARSKVILHSKKRRQGGQGGRWGGKSKRMKR
ncbi:La-like protein [Armadillidium nasatum]|uniref:La-like protein n=1 Tax=Armadillidium nasatum TaxID=96803 RepID=A0A5N5TAA6_9CRUS|nr:La-like protein [Armadillidium nasatum]